MRRPGYVMLLIAGILYVAIGIALMAYIVLGSIFLSFDGVNDATVAVAIFSGIYSLLWITLGVIGIFQRNGFIGIRLLIFLIAAVCIDAIITVFLLGLVYGLVVLLYLPVPILYAIGAYRNKL